MMDEKLLGTKLANIASYIYNSDGVPTVSKINTSINNRIVQIIYVSETAEPSQMSMWDLIDDAVKKLKLISFNLTIVPTGEGQMSVGFITGTVYLVPPTRGDDLFFAMIEQIDSLINHILSEAKETNEQ